MSNEMNEINLNELENDISLSINSINDLTNKWSSNKRSSNNERNKNLEQVYEDEINFYMNRPSNLGLGSDTNISLIKSQNTLKSKLVDKNKSNNSGSNKRKFNSNSISNTTPNNDIGDDSESKFSQLKKKKKNLKNKKFNL